MAFLEPSRFQDMREAFASQFKDELNGIVYRKHGIGEGVVVSSEERDKFVENFNKYLSKIRWHLIGCVCVSIVLPFVIGGLFSLRANNLGILFWTFMAVGILWFVRSNHRAFGAPAVALADRQPSGATVTKTEAQRDVLKKLDWSTFALGPAIAMLISYRMEVFDAPFALDRIFWTIMSVGILLLFAVQAVRKWTIEKDDRLKDK